MIVQLCLPTQVTKHVACSELRGGLVLAIFGKHDYADCCNQWPLLRSQKPCMAVWDVIATCCLCKSMVCRPGFVQLEAYAAAPLNSLVASWVGALVSAKSKACAALICSNNAAGCYVVRRRRCCVTCLTLLSSHITCQQRQFRPNRF